jgi:hypothetical protein
VCRGDVGPPLPQAVLVREVDFLAYASVRCTMHHASMHHGDPIGRAPAEHAVAQLDVVVGLRVRAQHPWTLQPHHRLLQLHAAQHGALGHGRARHRVALRSAVKGSARRQARVRGRWGGKPSDGARTCSLSPRCTYGPYGPSLITTCTGQGLRYGSGSRSVGHGCTHAIRRAGSPLSLSGISY